MKFLICGLGSIGQRHVRILRQLLGNDAQVSAYRVRNLPIVINDDMTARHGIRPEDHYGLKTFNDLDAALDDGPDAVIVTNPISMHVETAMKAARRGAHLFVEKPLGDSLDGVEALRSEVRRLNLVTAVGYQLRYHPGIERVRGMLLSGMIGRVASADIHFGEWLPGMHPYENYTESHAARADQGGGAILCLSHEIDIAAWLFGNAVRVTASGGHLSDLQMNGVEDVADILLSFEMDGRLVPVHVHLDFLQRPPRRYGRIIGERGTIDWDYFANTVTLRSAGSSDAEVHTFPGFRRNDMFVAEMQDFIDAIRSGRETRVPLAEGIRTLEICLAARASLRNNSGPALSSDRTGSAAPVRAL